jgi:hypothetical protein
VDGDRLIVDRLTLFSMRSRPNSTPLGSRAPVAFSCWAADRQNSGAHTTPETPNRPRRRNDRTSFDNMLVPDLAEEAVRHCRPLNYFLQSLALHHQVVSNGI